MEPSPPWRFLDPQVTGFNTKKVEWSTPDLKNRGTPYDLGNLWKPPMVERSSPVKGWLKFTGAHGARTQTAKSGD